MSATELESSVAPRARARTTALLAMLAAFLVHGHVLGLGLLGHDTFPLLAASRLEGPAELLRPFHEELMGGRFRGAFYRPVHTALLAFEQGLWGPAAEGYQFVNLLALGGAALALFLMARRLLGRSALAGPAVAAAAFVLHPGVWEVVPVVARRSDTLAALFLFAGIGLVAREARAGRLVAVAFATTLLAAGSKETGFALAPLACLAAFLFPRGRSGARAALLAAVGAGGAAAVALAARVAVLGGLGGYGATGEGFARHATRLLGWLLLPPQVVPPATGVPSLVGCGGLLLLAGLVLAVGRHRSPSSEVSASANSAATPADIARTGVLGLALACVTALLSATGGQSHPWYLLLPSSGLALLLGALAAGASAAPRTAASRATGVLVTLLLAAGVASQFALQGAATWAAASERLTAYLGGLEQGLATAPDGSLLTTPAPPEWERVPRNAVGVRGASILLDYSVEAWSELRFPGRVVKFVRHTAGETAPSPPPDGVLVLLRTPAVGADGRRRQEVGAGGRRRP